MFLKPFRVKTQSALKNSDRKKLRADICSQFPNLSDEDVSALIPNKVEMNVTRISTHRGEVAQIYFVQQIPIVFESYKNIYPTVYALWKFPDLVPVFRTWAPVFEKLKNGADLMLPGVIYDQEPSSRMFGNLQKGEIVSVSMAGNRSPVAVGQALLSGEDMFYSGMKGKGVGMVHMLGDALWEAGDKSMPPSRPEPLPSDADEEDVDDGEAGDENAVPDMEGLQIDDGATSSAQQDGESGLNGENGGDVDGNNPVAEMDELLHRCFGCAIKSRIKDSDLPLRFVDLMKDFVQPFSPAKLIDIKKSSYKKLSKFLQHMASESYITVKEQTKGVDVITTVDRNHPTLTDLEVPEPVEVDTLDDGAASSKDEDVCKPLTFTDVYCVNAATADLFKDARISKGEALKIADVKEAVSRYIQLNKLMQADKKTVTLDPILAHMILKPVDGDLDHMPLEHVFNRMVGKMQSAVAISSSDGLISIKKGKFEPIKMDVDKRASNKKMTIIENLEEYGFNLKAFARIVQRAVACSCSVVQTEQKNKGPQVQVQGNQIAFVGKLLIEKYKIPKKYVVGLDKAVKQKKR